MASRSQTSTRSSGRTTRGGRSIARGGRATATRSSRSKRSSGTRARAPARKPFNRYANFEGQVSPEQLDELLLQAIETELGGIQVYESAIRCAQDEELKEEWTKYLEQTRNHERILTDVFQQRGLDVMQESPGRRVVRGLGESLVEAMETALAHGSPQAAELVAAECVVLAETKDHANWELIGEVAKALGDDDFAQVLKEAHDEVEEEEDEHLYHTMGWSRELWIRSLGMPAVLPPPEEEKDVKTAIGAAKAKAGRKRMLSSNAR
jgi:ferritin-like metal-binding protein YciE